MKPKFYLLLLAPVLMLASCKKWTVDNDYNNIVGDWKLVSAERQRSYGTEPVYTGYENGVFYFSNNQNAEYSDNYGSMTGSWRMVQHGGGYGNNPSLELRLYDYYDNRVIEWEFYSIEFVSSNRMIGYMTRYGEEFRFEFRRY